MERLRHINWSEVVRRAIEEAVRREESKLRERDKARMRAAVIRTDKLRRLVPGWSSVEEIRRWRERK
ncbi:MAG: VapB-type antitoxin [Thaumarchaeota archaeon]|nr:MAG: VapB-type antitoxin [Nitrososphaerota archaeon]